MGSDKADPSKPRKNPYKFHVWDKKQDPEQVLFSFSYCDDNDASHGAESMDELYEEISKAVRMTGYFSVVTKLGRAGSKNSIHLYNLDPRHAKKVLDNWKFESYAWSFKHDSIIKEDMPFKAHFLKSPEAMKDLSQENKDALVELEKRSSVVKSLGVSTRSNKPDSKPKPSVNRHS